MDLVFEVLVTLAAATSLGLAVWSGRGHFQSDRMPLGSMVIALTILVTTALDLFLVWTQAQPLGALVVGFLLQAAGISLFALTIRASRQARLRMAFDEGNPRGLVMEGPYRFVRHPFYVSYIIYFTGFAIATWEPIAVFPLAIILVIYITAARMEEGKFANTAMAAEYEAYRRRVGFFFPKIASA
jgi:protein-S-isoprenylcysteine O-methyltransferase Ste14